MIRHRLRRALVGLGGAAAIQFLVILLAPHLWRTPQGEIVLALGVISAAVPLVSSRLWVVAVIQVALAAVSPLSWPSAGVTVFLSARHGRLAAAALMMCATAAATIAAILLALPDWFAFSIPTQVQVLVIGTAVIALSLVLLAGFVDGYRRGLAARAAMIRMRERDDLVRQVEQARGAERERLTSELHDTLGNRIALLRAILDGDDTSGSTARARVQASKAADDLRALVSGRTGDARTVGGPLDALREVVAEAREAGLQLSLNLHSGLDSIPRIQQQMVFDLVREGITNALKYASPGLVVIVAAIRDKTVDVAVSSPASHPPRTTTGEGGWGLLSLTERARLMDGVLDRGFVDSRFELHLTFPSADADSTASR